MIPYIVFEILCLQDPRLSCRNVCATDLRSNIMHRIYSTYGRYRVEHISLLETVPTPAP
jgi:hypothetical protein